MSTFNNICNDPTYLTSLLIKKKFKIFNVNIPPQRYNSLQNSPYISNNSFNKIFTQSELNMRRKAEILKYSATQSNTKTNNLTKKEKWSQLVNGSSQKRNLSYSFIQNNLLPGTTNYINTCPSGTILYTPSSASGIPGPIINLYEDPTIPLYMYSSNTDPYGIINKDPTTQQFDYDNTQVNQYINQTNYVIITSIFIINILTPTYTFNIQFPISIFIYAEVLNKQNETYNDSLTISFLNYPFQTNTYYGSNIVQKKGIINNPSIVPPSSKSVTFDISLNLNNDTFFSGNQYIGMYSINNLTLNTQQGYVYDICLNNVSSFDIPSFKLTDLSGNFSSKFKNISYGICANIEFNQLNQFKNCKVNNPSSFPSITTYKMLSVK
jgi:hypothetical protein